MTRGTLLGLLLLILCHVVLAFSKQLPEQCSAGASTACQPVFFPWLSAERPKELLSVFFSGQPWVVICDSSEAIEKPPVSRDDPLREEDSLEASESVAEATDEHVQSAEDADDLGSEGGIAGAKSRSLLQTIDEALRFLRDSGEEEGIKAAKLDCNAKLPSGKSTLERFNLQPKSTAASMSPLVPPPPPVLVFVNGEKPVRVSQEQMSSSLRLAWFIRETAKLRVHALSKTSEMHKRCFPPHSSGCVLVVSNTTLAASHKSMLLNLKNDLRHVPFVYINATSYQFSMESSLPGLYQSIAEKEHASFRTVHLSSTGSSTSTSTSPTSVSSTQNGPFVPRVVVFKDSKSKQKSKKSKADTPGVSAVAYRDRFETQSLGSFLRKHLLEQPGEEGVDSELKALKSLPTLQQRKAPKPPPVKKDDTATKAAAPKAEKEGDKKAKTPESKRDKPADKQKASKPKAKESDELRKMRIRREQMEKEEQRRKRKEEDNIINKVLKQHAASQKDATDEGNIDLDGFSGDDEASADAEDQTQDPWLQWEDEQEEDL